MVSVVLPAYKSQFLGEAIDSILSQSFTDFELIIVNDASPQPVDSVVARYDDSRIKYYVNEKNIGRENLVANWNHCLQYASGEFIVLASDDDLYHPDFLKTLVSLARKYPAVDVFHCRVGVINENGDPIFWSPSIAEYETDIDFIYQRSVNRRTQLISDFLLRKAALDAISGFCQYPKAWYSDEMTLYRLSLGKGVVCSRDTLFYWRSSDQNISSTVTDIDPKTDATLLYYKDMGELIEALRPTDDKDRFIKSLLLTKYRESAAQQLIYDLAKAPYRKMFSVLRQKRVGKDFLTRRDKAKLTMLLFRRLLKV